MTFMLTRINVGDYDAWKPQFDTDAPGARQSAKGHRVFRSGGRQVLALRYLVVT